MSVRADQTSIQAPAGTGLTPGGLDAIATINAAQAADSPLDTANDFNTINPDHPLKRTVVATIRSSLDDLCLRKAKATWAPSPEALQAILRQVIPRSTALWLWSTPSTTIQLSAFPRTRSSSPTCRAHPRPREI